MNNQAAQTMPELPGPFDVIEQVDKYNFVHNVEVYTADQMHQYARDYAASQTAGVADDSRRMDFLVSKCVEVREPARYGSLAMFRAQDVSDEGEGYQNDLRERIDQAMLSAALAASGGESAASLSSNPNPVTPSLSSESAASVSERARELLVAECPECGGSNGYMVPAGEHGGAWQKCSTCQDGERLNSVSRYQALRALEQALTQQRGSSAPVATLQVCPPNSDGTATYFMDRVRDSDAFSKLLPGNYLLYTTPQPSADAVRELVKRILNWQPLTSINKADRLYQILIAAGIPFESITDELESLLSGGSHA